MRLITRHGRPSYSVRLTADAAALAWLDDGLDDAARAQVHAALVRAA